MGEERAPKQALRERVRAARAALPPDVRATRSAAIATRALAIPEVAGARAVLAYTALAGEADPAPLLEVLRRRGARIALPRVCGPQKLSLHWVEPDTPLSPGALGTSEPSPECASATASDFDLVIVPGVAFDPACARLGFGGGFYDALLPTLPSRTLAVGLAFDEQIVGAVPCESHDEPVDMVVTPTSVHRRRR